jgi:ABC-type multidrug transport system fused ATPase/permease subunit
MIKEAREELKQENPIILENINLVFEKWKTYWLVWKNWAGKTTLISLIMNYFDEYSWKINIDEINIKDIERDFFTKSISVINQVPYIINWFSVRENLLLWVNKKYSDDSILELLENFWIKKKVLKNRKWLDAEIWYWNDFSGWEKQLLVIIRIILQDRQILIMDEWTNQLDAENEILVMDELLKNRKDKIVIFITHRMTTIRKVDLIYCIEDWKITTNWTHKSLIWGKNIYANFWRKQVEE